MFRTRPNSNSVVALVRRSSRRPRGSAKNIGNQDRSEFPDLAYRDRRPFCDKHEDPIVAAPVAEAHWQLAAFRSTTCLSRRRETAILREAAAGIDVEQTLRIATVDFAVGRKLPHAMNVFGKFRPLS